MAIWLMAGLLDVVDRLYVLSDKGERPSLLPIRRSLQMIVDNMKSFSGIYQMLSAFRDPNTPRYKITDACCNRDRCDWFMCLFTKK